MEAPTDRELAAQAAAGEVAAFAALVERHVPRLHRWLVVTGTTHHDADDIVQDACLRAHLAIGRYDARWAFTTWLFTIAHRVRLDHVARRRDHAAVPEDLSAPPAEDDPLPSGGLWARARQVLPPDDYRALWLHYAEDQPAAAVARILGINPIAVRVRLHRARRRLEAALRADPGLVTMEPSA